MSWLALKMTSKWTFLFMLNSSGSTFSDISWKRHWYSNEKLYLCTAPAHSTIATIEYFTKLVYSLVFDPFKIFGVSSKDKDSNQFLPKKEIWEATLIVCEHVNSEEIQNLTFVWILGCLKSSEKTRVGHFGNLCFYIFISTSFSYVVFYVIPLNKSSMFLWSFFPSKWNFTRKRLILRI